MTTTGETKVIERFDCSGCGDVDTSTVRKCTDDGYITGVTGRKLKVSNSELSLILLIELISKSSNIRDDRFTLGQVFFY